MANHNVNHVDYTVVTGPADDIEDFNGQIITHLNSGWICVGGVSTAISGAGAVLFQAMTKTTQIKASEFEQMHGHRYGGKRTTRKRRN